MHVLHCLKCSQTSVIYEFFFFRKKVCVKKRNSATTTEKQQKPKMAFIFGCYTSFTSTVNAASKQN